MKERITKTYKSLKHFQKDKVKMEKDSWVVVSQSSHKESYKAGKGCLLGLIFLPLMVFGRGKSSLIVNYEREIDQVKS